MSTAHWHEKFQKTCSLSFEEDLVYVDCVRESEKPEIFVAFSFYARMGKASIPAMTSRFLKIHANFKIKPSVTF